MKGLWLLVRHATAISCSTKYFVQIGSVLELFSVPVWCGSRFVAYSFHTATMQDSTES